MERDPDSTSRSERPVTVFTIASVVTGLGTAWIDPARLWLFFIPLTFLMAAHQTGVLIELGAIRHGLTRFLFPAGRLAVRLGIGTAALSLFTFLTGLAGVLALAGVVIVGLFGLAAVRAWQTVSRAGFVSPSLRATGAGLLVGAAWLVSWLWATTPPVFYDELSYHLVVPQHALSTGSLPAYPWVFFTLMPHASDVLLAWGMGIGKLLERYDLLSGGADLGARAMVWTLWIACTVIACGLLAVIVWPRKLLLGPPLILAAFATSPTLWFVATLPFGESCAAIGVLTAAVILAASARHGSAKGACPWVFLGLVLGLVGTAKLTGVYWVAAGLAAASIARWNWRGLLSAGFVAAGSMAPWWGRALIYTGNPIYPMGYDILGGKFWGPDSQARVMGDVSVRLRDLDVIGLLQLPLDLIRHPERFGSGADVGVLAVVVTGVVLCLPVMLRMTGAEPTVRRLADMAAVFVAVAGVGWLMTSTVTRFFAPAFLICLVAMSAVIVSRRVPLQAALVMVVMCAGLWGSGRFMTEHEDVFGSWNVALGRESRDSYTARQVDHFAVARFVRESLPVQARLLFIGETRPYYFARSGIAPTAYDTHPLDRWVRETDSSDALAHRLASEGISHVVLNKREFKRLNKSYGLLAFTAAGDEAGDRRLKELPAKLKLLFSENGVYVFEVPGAPATARAMELSRG